jgi:hypothetical protein
VQATLAVWRGDEAVDALCISLFRELLTYMIEDPLSIIGPWPGDITICIKCGLPLVFNDEMKLRELNDDEIKLFGMFF